MINNPEPNWPDASTIDPETVTPPTESEIEALAEQMHTVDPGRTVGEHIGAINGAIATTSPKKLATMTAIELLRLQNEILRQIVHGGT